MGLEQEQKSELFKAIWDNFEQFEIIGFPNDEQSTFLTQSKVRRFQIKNFINAYGEGQMDIEDLVYVLF